MFFFLRKINLYYILLYLEYILQISYSAKCYINLIDLNFLFVNIGKSSQ